MAYKKQFKNKNTTKCIIKNIPMYINDDANIEVIDEIIEIIASIPFNKFSVPLNAYRKSVLDEPDSTKSLTVGFVRGFNDDDATFDVIIFDTFEDAVKKFNKCGIEINFGIWKDHLSKINKLTLINVATVDNDIENEPTDAVVTDIKEAAE